MAFDDDSEMAPDFLARTVPPTHFTAAHLHDRNDRIWAVLSQPSGAIAEDDQGDLLMHLTEDEASALAAEMSAGLRKNNSVD
ncbi:hypothetical protein [Chenggangzhangella methanolivorans]|uniref:Uncharacterized protein n=1 Tax=Chenggangzhangella methanolivorans TaxID=1437009 RepID=A0A9E6RCU1_9HYPH|nr:hypothetical protein [Chenggangzhangella methanolivorans]QZO01975.1 hypothetical protein K6K41_12120 [Chenggangzhangella methanolivorans]